MSRVVPPSGEPVPPTKRRKVTKAERLEIWLRDNGKCARCGLPVAWGTDLQIDHPNALINGGSDDRAAMVSLHVRCHKEKTAADVRIAAKIKRIIAREDGTRRERPKIRSRPFPKGKKRPWPSRPFQT